MSNKYFIIGATGALGFAVARAIQNSGEGATLLVRNRTSAIERFGNIDGLDVVEGDINDVEAVKQIAVGAQYIFHGANVSYEHWVKAMPVMTRNVIAVAEHVGATIVFPGNNYNYGPIEQPISEITPFRPSTKLGETRVRLEKLLQQATDQGRIRTLVVCLAEIWGPNVTNKSFAPIFENALKGKSMPWLVSADVAQQLLYAPDAGRAIYALMQRDDLRTYEVFNVGGHRVESMRDWLELVGEVAGTPAKVNVLPKQMLFVLGLFIPVMREVRSLAYKFEMPIMLSDQRFRTAVPNFVFTPMRQAIAETLIWFDGGDAERVG